MKKYKICPSCQTKNPPTLFECLNCEADLTMVKIMDEETEKANQIVKSDTKPEAETVMLIRLCECGTKNPPNARKCSICGEDISDVTPTPDKSETPKEESFVLSSLDGQYAFKIAEKTTEVGKESRMSEYLTAKPYVSRHHAVFSILDGKLYIENISTTNYTFVNNIKISEKTELHDGDEIGLGGTSINGNRQTNAAYFLVRIGTCI